MRFVRAIAEAKSPCLGRKSRGGQLIDSRERNGKRVEGMARNERLVNTFRRVSTIPFVRPQAAYVAVFMLARIMRSVINSGPQCNAIHVSICHTHAILCLSRSHSSSILHLCFTVLRIGRAARANPRRKLDTSHGVTGSLINPFQFSLKYWRVCAPTLAFTGSRFSRAPRNCEISARLLPNRIADPLFIH